MNQTEEKTRETRGRRIRAIEKAIELLDCFWRERRPLSLRELEQYTHWAKSTIHGLLASMLDSGVLEQNASDGKYRLGYHLFELGSAVNQSWGVPEIAAPYLQGIVDTVHESAYLARLSGNELLLAACEEPHTGFRIVSEVGTRLPLHASSQGKVILAFRPPYEAERLLRLRAPQSFTPNTIADQQSLLSLLPQIRTAGYAEELEEYKLGLKSVAAPIFDGRGECRYAISVICLASVGEKDFRTMREAVIRAAEAVTQELKNRYRKSPVRSDKL